MNGYVKRGGWVAATLLVCAGQTLSAQGASFDCGKASTKVEHIICDDPEISKLDEELATAYKAALQDKAKAEAIKQAQKKWLKVRNECPDADCVKNIYVQRNSLLIGMATITPEDFERAKYVISSGKGNALCEQMLTRMNELLLKYPHGPICAYDALKTIPGVTFPDWEKLPLKANEPINGFCFPRWLTPGITLKYLGEPEKQLGS